MHKFYIVLETSEVPGKLWTIGNINLQFRIVEYIINNADPQRNTDPQCQCLTHYSRPTCGNSTTL